VNPTSKAFKAAARELAKNPGAYAAELEALRSTERVSLAVIAAAGRTDKVITGVARVSRVAGPIGLAINVGAGVYAVVEAPEDQRLYIAALETAGFAGGSLGALGGGLAGAWVASLLCGPAAPVCAVVVSIVVIGAASYAGGEIGRWGLKKAAGPPPRRGNVWSLP
jgi:hypothetical protein